jgi:hypothetical protein
VKELPTSGTVNAVDARELLHDLAGLRQRGRRPAGLWPPLVVFGVVAVAGTPLAAWRSLAGDLWWVAAAPVGFALVGRFAAGQARGRGYQAPGWPLTTLGIASFGAGWLACLALAIALPLPTGLGWALAVSAGYLAWSWFARSWPAALVAVSLAVVGTALALSTAPSWTVQAGVGLAMLAGGLLLRHGPESASRRGEEAPSRSGPEASWREPEAV